MSTQGPPGGGANPANYIDDEDQAPSAGKVQMKKAFDCPDCTANNPYDDGFGAGDEVRCYYCGSEFLVVDQDGKFRYRPA